MPTATQDKKDVKTQASTDGVYWFGALPATEPVPYQFPTRDPQGNGQFFRVDSTSAYDLSEKQNRIWIGKCRYIQSLSIKGLVLPAFSEIPERQASLDSEVSLT